MAPADGGRNSAAGIAWLSRESALLKGGIGMKKYSVSTSGGWRQRDMSLDDVANLVRLLSMDKQEGKTITFEVTVQTQEIPDL